MTRKKTGNQNKTKKTAVGRPYYLLASFVAFVAVSLMYVAPLETPSVAKGVVKCLPILCLILGVLRKESFKGEVILILIGLSISLCGDYYLVSVVVVC